ncbi:Hypothetical protein SMAX5B_000071 [Scophthalmus maximus]|nr:Hypothetical protein SMAX5B_000071 [Scophthalmus maximus]
MGDINIYILPEAAAAAGGEKKVAPGPTREVKSGLVWAVWSGRGRAPSPFTDRLTDAHIRLLTSSPRASEQLRSGNRRQARQAQSPPLSDDVTAFIGHALDGHGDLLYAGRHRM